MTDLDKQKALSAFSIVGIGDDGAAGLTPRARWAVQNAELLAGSERQLALFADFDGERVVLQKGLRAGLENLATRMDDKRICLLASGDPLFYGIGSLAVKIIGGDKIEFIPQPSAIQLAFSRVGIAWQDAKIISLHARSCEGFLTRIRHAAKVACFTDATNSPAAVATRLLDYNDTAWEAWVCERLGGVQERVRHFATPADLAACADIDPLNILILRRTDPTWQAPPRMSYLHEDEFAKRMPKQGLITKREVRTLSLAALAIRPRDVVWDIGAGSGSMSIEAALLAEEGHVYAVETNTECVDFCRENILAHRVDNVRVVAGRAPDALADLDAPDAVFVGGSKGQLAEIIKLALTRLSPGGRLVVNAITFENVGEAYQTFRGLEIMPEVIQLNISRGKKVAHYLRYEALNPIHIFSVTKPLG